MADFPKSYSSLDLDIHSNSLNYSSSSARFIPHFQNIICSMSSVFFLETILPFASLGSTLPLVLTSAQNSLIHQGYCPSSPDPDHKLYQMAREALLFWLLTHSKCLEQSLENYQGSVISVVFWAKFMHLVILLTLVLILMFMLIFSLRVSWRKLGLQTISGILTHSVGPHSFQMTSASCFIRIKDLAQRIVIR